MLYSIFFVYSLSMKYFAPYFLFLTCSLCMKCFSYIQHQLKRYRVKMINISKWAIVFSSILVGIEL